MGALFKRLFTGRGAGIPVMDILNLRTNAPHWKEYSVKEIRTYFESLSSDFSLGALKTF